MCSQSVGGQTTIYQADKMTMANGLELRRPFWNHKLKFAATLPNGRKSMAGWKDACLRARCGDSCPTPIMTVRKGISVPMRIVVRTSLRHSTRDHLLSRDSRCSRYVDAAKPVRLVEDMTKRATVQELDAAGVRIWHRHFSEEPRLCVKPPSYGDTTRDLRRAS